MPNNVLPLHIKRTFLPINQIFTEGEGDEIGSRLPFKIFSTLTLSQPGGAGYAHHITTGIPGFLHCPTALHFAQQAGHMPFSL